MLSHNVRKLHRSLLSVTSAKLVRPTYLHRSFNTTAIMSGDSQKFSYLPLATNKPLECALTVRVYLNLLKSIHSDRYFRAAHC